MNMIGKEIGQYRLTELIDQGAYSVVYKAKDNLNNKPAVVKILQFGGLDHEAVLKLIEPEIEIISKAKPRLLVRVHSVGELDGKTYLAMEYMKGGSLAGRLSDGPLSFDEAFGILSVLAPVIDYLHQLNCVHGDIKPTNILFDANDRPFLSDYGIYKLVRAAAPGDQVERVIGSPAYSSPEQLLGKPDVDFRSDIYMLGVLLYEMLAGKLPFGETPALEQAARRLVFPPQPLSELRPDLPPGIDAVIQKALQPEPSRRFSTVGEFVDALENVDQFLTTPLPESLPALTPAFERPEPVYIYPKTSRGGKVRRFKPGCFFILWLLIGGLSFLAISGFSLLLQTPYKGFLDPLFATPVVQNLPAQTPTTQPPVTTPSLTPSPSPTPISTPSPTPTNTTTPASTPDLPVKTLIPGLVEKGALAATDHFVDQLVTCFDVAGQYEVDYQSLVEANPLVDCRAVLRQGIRIKIPAQEAYTYTMTHPPIDAWGIGQLEQKLVLDDTGEPRALDFSTQGDLLAVASGKDIYIWRVGEWKPYRQLRGHLAFVNDVEFSQNGLLLASVSDDTSVRVWDVKTGKTIRTFYGHSKPVTGVAIAHDNTNVVSVSMDGTLRYWTVSSGIGSVGRLDPAFSVAYSPDGKYLAVGMENKVRIYPAGRVDWLFDLETQGIVRSLAFSSDSELLATNQEIWQLRLNKRLYDLPGRLDGVVFTSDNQSLVFGSEVFSTVNGEKISNFEVQLGVNDRLDLDMQKSGGLIAVAGKKGISIWGFPSSYEKAEIPETSPYTVVDGDTLFNIAYDHQVKVSSLITLNGLTCDDPIYPSQQVLIPLAEEARVNPNTQALDLITADNLARIQEYQSFEMTCVKTVSELVFSPDSQMLVGGSALWQNDSGVVRIEAPDVPRLLDGKPDQNLVSSILAVAPDNNTLALRSGSLVIIWDSRTGRVVKTLSNHQDQVTSLAFSPDGTLLASAGGLKDAKIRIWNLTSNDPIQPLENLIANELFFTADGKALIIVTAESVLYWQVGAVEAEQLVRLDSPVVMTPDRTKFAYIRCLSYSGQTCLSSAAISYDIDLGREHILIAFRDKIQALAYSQDGRFLVGGTENNISIWDLTTDQVVQTLRITDSRAEVTSLTFSNDGSFIAAVDARGVLRIWHVISAAVLYSSLDAGLQPVVRVAFSPDSQLLAIQEGASIRLFGVPR